MTPRVQVRINLTLAGADLRRLLEFQAREEFPSPTSALRALVLAAIDTYPKIGIMREARINEANLARQRIVARVIRTFSDVITELETQLPEERNAEAAVEKGQVTFTREDQE